MKVRSRPILWRHVAHHVFVVLDVVAACDQLAKRKPKFPAGPAAPTSGECFLDRQPSLPWSGSSTADVLEVSVERPEITLLARDFVGQVAASSSRSDSSPLLEFHAVEDHCASVTDVVEQKEFAPGRQKPSSARPLHPGRPGGRSDIERGSPKARRARSWMEQIRLMGACGK